MASKYKYRVYPKRGLDYNLSTELTPYQISKRMEEGSVIVADDARTRHDMEQLYMDVYGRVARGRGDDDDRKFIDMYDKRIFSSESRRRNASSSSLRQTVFTRNVEVSSKVTKG